MSFKRGLAAIIVGCAGALFGCKENLPASAVPQVGVAAKDASAEPPTEASVATVTEHDFITMRDGVRLRYVVKRPDTATRVPLILNYNPYNAGSDQADDGIANLEPELMRRGYAVAGLQARGTGCSEGAFGVFDQQVGEDGYDAIEWFASQPWSDGRIGMAGHSGGGMTQLYVAGERPPHLRAIVPHAQVGDIYRDLAYPGGIPEYMFPTAWTFIQKALYAPGPASDPDPECPEIYARHEAANVQGDNFVPFLFLDHPYVDDDGAWPARAPNANFRGIL